MKQTVEYKVQNASQLHVSTENIVQNEIFISPSMINLGVVGNAISISIDVLVEDAFATQHIWGY